MEKTSDNISPDKAMSRTPVGDAAEAQAQAVKEPAAEEAPVQAAATQTDALDEQILQLQQQLEELRRQRQLEQQQKLETERKKKQIEALQAAIRAEQSGEAAPAEAAAVEDAARPRGSFAFPDDGDDDNNPFVQAARESAESADAAGADSRADSGGADPFYTGKPAFEAASRDRKARKKKEKKSAPADDGPREHNGFFRGLAAGAPVILLVMLALVCWTPLVMGDLVCPKEVDYLKVLSGVHGLNLLPHSADLAVMPVLGWLAWAVSLIPLPELWQYPLLSFAGAAVCLLGMCVLCGCARLGRNVMFGSGLLLLCLPLFLGMASFIGPVPLACGLSLMAMGCICRGWMRNFDLGGMVAGNVLAALAVLAGGLYYGLVPVLAGLIFAVWRGNMQRLRNTDAVAGVVVFVAALLIWFGCLILFDGNVSTEMLRPALFTWPDPAAFINRLTMAAVAFCPFLIIVVTVSWPRIIAHSVSNVRASRSENASAYLWVALVLAIAGAFISAQTFDIFLALCLMAVLTARALLSLGRFGTRSFFILVGLMLLGVTLAMLSIFVPDVRHIVLPMIPGLAAVLPADFADFASRFWQSEMYLCLGLCLMPLIAAAVICHVAWRARTAAAPLLVSAVCVLVLAQPVGLLLPPVFVQVPLFKLEAAAAILSDGLCAAPEATAETPDAPVTEPAPAETPAAPAEESAAPEAAAEPAAPAEDAAPAAPAAPAEGPAAPEAAAEPAAPAEDAAPAETPAAESADNAAPAEAPAAAPAGETEAPAAEAPATSEAAADAVAQAGETPAPPVEEAVKAAADEARSE